MMENMQTGRDIAMADGGITSLHYWLTGLYGKNAPGQPDRNIKAGNWPVSAVWPRTPHLTLKVRLAVDKLVSDFPAMMASL